MRKRSIKLCGLCGLCGSHRFWCGSEFRIFHLSSDLELNFVCILWRNIHNEKLVRISIGKCEDLNCSLCGSGPSTDVTISDHRGRSPVRIWCADLICLPCGSGYAASVFDIKCIYLYYVITFSYLCQNFLVFLFQTVCLKPLCVQCIGGVFSKWRNKACRCVHKYFFVFLSK